MLLPETNGVVSVDVPFSGSFDADDDMGDDDKRRDYVEIREKNEVTMTKIPEGKYQDAIVR